MHFGLFLKDLERGYTREGYYPSEVLAMEAGAVYGLEYNLGWVIHLGYPPELGITFQAEYQLP